jgi:hypothetical protein
MRQKQIDRAAARTHVSASALGKDDSMRKIMLLLAMVALAACQSGKVYVGGEGEYYEGIVPPR